MEGNGYTNGDRRRLLIPLGLVLLVGWTAALARAVLDGDVQPLIVVSVPFGVLVGYVFGVQVIRSPR